VIKNEGKIKKEQRSTSTSRAKVERKFKRKAPDRPLLNREGQMAKAGNAGERGEKGKSNKNPRC